jgi:hypothetical protein
MNEALKGMKIRITKWGVVIQPLLLLAVVMALFKNLEVSSPVLICSVSYKGVFVFCMLSKLVKLMLLSYILLLFVYF